ncbi:MAG: hypothetical protein ACOZNI_05230, partial [Myxococcota bacterium]
DKSATPAGKDAAKPAKAGAEKDPAKEKEVAKKVQAESKKDAKLSQQVDSERKLEETQVKKAKAEVQAEAGEDVAKKATAAAEVEAKAKEEEAAEKEVVAKAEEVESAAVEAEGDEVEEVDHESELEGVDGERVTLVGTYVPRPAPGGTQMLGHVSILVGNVEVRLGTETRALSEVLRFAGERVAVTGKLDLKKSGGRVDPKKLEKPLLSEIKAPARR